MNRKTSIAFIAAGLIATTSAFAWYGETSDSEGREHRMKGGRHHAGMMPGKLSRHMDKEFTADQIRTLSEAKLIMQGNPNVRVDEVKPTDTGYSVTIVTLDSSLVKELQLAKNAMPLERYQAVQKRMEKHQNGERSERHANRGEHKGKHGRKGKRGQAGHKVMEREFTADQIETLTKAKLIMRGNENLKLGKVTSTENGYSVTIVTQDNSLVEERQLAKNGMPAEKFERLQKRIEARKAK